MDTGKVYTDADFSFAGHGLVRPECVLCLENGRLIAANFDGGISIVEPTGAVWHLLGQGGTALRPNGICLLADGSVLIAHLGETDGGVYRLRDDGRVEPFLLGADGIDLPPTNFVHRDRFGRTWISVSTRQVPRSLGYRPTVADGFLILVDEAGARIVADGLGFANECVLHPDGIHLWVNETFAKRVSVFRVADNGDLILTDTFSEFGEGEFPDGMAFDADGGAWIACIVANRLIRLSAGFRREMIVDGRDPDHCARVERAYRADALTSAHLGTSNGHYGNISSLAFGGPDLRTIYLGTLLGERIAHFRQPIRGAKPVHWQFGGPRRRK